MEAFVVIRLPHAMKHLMHFIMCPNLQAALPSSVP
jgi:hypothetical protein